MHSPTVGSWGVFVKSEVPLQGVSAHKTHLEQLEVVRTLEGLSWGYSRSQCYIQTDKIRALFDKILNMASKTMQQLRERCRDAPTKGLLWDASIERFPRVDLGDVAVKTLPSDAPPGPSNTILCAS